MISRPSFPLVAFTLAGILVVTYLAFGPFPETLWRRFDPAGYALARVREAHWFTVPYLNDVLEIEEPIRSWRVLAHSPSPDTLFLDLHRLAEKPAARLYAIAGLALIDSALATEAAGRLSGDTLRVVVNLLCSEPGTLPSRPLSELAALTASPAFARRMRDGGAGCP